MITKKKNLKLNSKFIKAIEIKIKKKIYKFNYD
jgi:hypothetical protein